MAYYAQNVGVRPVTLRDKEEWYAIELKRNLFKIEYNFRVKITPILTKVFIQGKGSPQ